MCECDPVGGGGVGVRDLDPVLHSSPGAGTEWIASIGVDESGSSHVNEFQNEATGGPPECFVVQHELAHGDRLAFHQIETAFHRERCPHRLESGIRFVENRWVGFLSRCVNDAERDLRSAQRRPTTSRYKELRRGRQLDDT